MRASQLPAGRSPGSTRSAPDPAPDPGEGSPTGAAATRRLSTRRARATEPDGPTVLDRYRLVRRLGSGGFGTVWHARDERLEREVAVKVLPRERIVGGRFEREAKAAARLAHPGIVTLYEAAVDDDGAYLVSELVRGGTLAELLRDGRLSDRDIVTIGLALCDALDHAHAHGVVHRDVKPSNILVPERAATPAQSAKLTDFGVARVVGGDTLTRTGDVIGTMAYMAPEQAEGREAAETADLYSLALVIYEALTGVNPVLTGTVAVRARRLGAYLPPLRRQRRELPRALGHGIDLALRPRPRERGTVSELRQALSLSLELVEDEPGIVQGPWPTVTAAPPDPPAQPAPQGAPFASGRPAAGGWPVRALGALAAAGLTAWIVARPLAPAPLPPAAMALVAGLLVLALPRVGWLALVLGTGLIATTQGLPGLALVLVVAGLMPVLLMPLRGGGSSLPAICPALGVVGLSGAWPALAGWSASAWRRAALGAIGWLWMLIASPLTGQALYVRAPTPSPAAAQWMGSVRVAAQHILHPLLSPSLLVPAAVWALGAMVLPLAGRRRTLRPMLAAVTLWSVVVAAGTVAAMQAAPGAHGVILGGEGVLGGLAGAIAATAAFVVPVRRGRRDSPAADPQLS